MDTDFEIAEILGKFNKRQAAFIQAYIEHENGSKAARDAGFSPKSCRHQATKLLKNDKIKAAITKIREKLSRTHQFTLEEAIKEAEELQKRAEKNRQFNAVAKFYEIKCKMTGHLVEKMKLESDKPLFNLVIGGIAPPSYALESQERDVTPEIEGKDESED
jgi:phage terminase small subunit